MASASTTGNPASCYLLMSFIAFETKGNALSLDHAF